MSATGRPEREYRSAQREGAPMTDALRTGIDLLRIAIDRAAQDKLLAYVELLDKWNRTHNLTAIREREQMITHHLLDSLAVLPHLPATVGLRVADVGSGGGMPGIPLAIARPDWHATLIDSNHKKTSFLTQAAIELPLPNVAVVTARVEDVVPLSSFDIVISRAYSTLSTFTEQTGHLLAPDGRWVAMKGALPNDEMAALPATIRVEATPLLQVPGVDGERHLVIMKMAVR
jgi:16S rRNA (guanine527-N7)-methyltransferase